MRMLALAGVVMASGCVSAPLAPDPTMDARGDYRVVAVNGEATGGGERYHFTITPPTGSARFGCNAGGGSLAVERGYVVTGDWIVTAAGCPGRDNPHHERVGFRITSLPMAIERRADGGIRLRNKLGSIDLARLSSPVVIGKWRAVAIDGVPLGEQDGLVMTLDTSQLRANACNEFAGGYRLDGRRIVPVGPWRETEKECYDPTGQYDPMAFEKRVFGILGSPLTASNPSPDSLRLQGRENRIDFVRAPALAPPPIVGEWTAVAFDSVAARPSARFSLTLTGDTVTTDGLCNDMPGHRYRIAGGRIMADGPPWPKSEKGCGPAEMRLEDRAWAVLSRSPAITMLGPDRMRLTSSAGSIDFERPPATTGVLREPGDWAVTRLNGRKVKGTFLLRPDSFSMFVGCNRLSGRVRLTEWTFLPGERLAATERECDLEPEKLDDEIFGIMGQEVRVSQVAGPTHLRLSNTKGSLEIEWRGPPGTLQQ